MDQPILKPLVATLQMTPEVYAELQRETGALELARAYAITGTWEEKEVMANEANKQLKSFKATIARLKDLKAGFVAPAKQIIAHAESLFDPALEACTQAEKFIKDELTRFTGEQQQRIEDARRQREAEERAARQKAEQEAAAARARAEEQARAKEREAAEAEERRAAAEREGNKRAAAAAAAEKAKAEEQARAAVENGEVRAQSIQLAASAAPTATVVPESQKLEGFSTRENYVAEFAPGVSEDDVKYVLCQAIAGGRRDLLSLLKFDMAAANRLAKAQKKNMNAPGLVAVNRPIAASRAA